MANSEKNSMAVASLVLGIVSVVGSFFGAWALLGLIAGIVGIVLAVKGKKIPAKKGMATAGLVLSIVGTSLSGLMFVCAACVLGTAGSIIGGLNSIQ